MFVFNCYCSRSLTYCSEVPRTSTCDHMISMGQECSICIQHGGNFTLLVFHGDSNFLRILGLRLNDFNFYVILVRNICCLYSVLFLFWAIVLKVVKLQVIWSCSEQNIFITVDKMFQHISVALSRLIDRLFTNLLNINITETPTEGKVFKWWRIQNIQTQICLIKSFKKQKYFIFDERCVKRPCIDE